jgi:hypothetical protein
VPFHIHIHIHNIVLGDQGKYLFVVDELDNLIRLMWEEWISEAKPLWLL